MDENQVSDIGGNAGENAAPAQEKMFTRDELAKIANAQTAKAVQQARREAEEKYQRDLEQANAMRQQQEQRNAETPRDVDADTIYQQVQERFNKEMQEQQYKSQMKQVADSYLEKVAKGRTTYDDFDEITKDFDPTAFPQLSFLLAGLDNGGEVLYDLSKNPIKLAGLDRLAEKNPRQAHAELLKLAKSISDNQQALSDSQNQQVAEPLDRLSPSRVSGSNGKQTVRDLRSQPWLKG
jgi:hypothetical protein